ncbi:MAG: hypothetical protein LUE64_04305 [Candidatus Gastranaerophilales bacterium]|nr:hypothetical protein [Candidatus Gastranaerophilales bacterium]
MLNLLQKNSSINLNEIFPKIAQIYGISDVTGERKEYLTKTIEKFGYLPYPHYKTLEELTDGEIIFALEKILEKEGVYSKSKFINYSNPSILSRKKIKNPDWFKKETQNIKLISLSALGNGTNATFIQWIAQIISLPKGCVETGVLADTIYLLPFHPREFGCAYLPASSEISSLLGDEKMLKFLNLDTKAQVKLFITLAQLSGHPVIYDILPQTGRFSKIILSHPYAARWANIKELTEKYVDALNKITEKLETRDNIDKNILSNVKNKYIQILYGSTDFYTSEEQDILNLIEEEMKEVKIALSNNISLKNSQEETVKKISALIELANGKKVSDESDIINRKNIIDTLIQEGYWPMPGGAWCSAGVPVFDKMNEWREYPVYKHYNYKGEDVSEFANLDCQTPYYFVYLENGKYNEKTIRFYLEYTSSLQKEYNFDGFRVDHIDHIVDNLSEQNNIPISYRIPRKVLGKINSNLKKNTPYFATLAEYMLWDDYYEEYHKDMNFDVLWGDDIVSQTSKTPEQIIKDNKKLEDYNFKNGKSSMLSILKTYNNQDGEFEAIDRYPGQLGENGALFKWFKYKFLPGGNWANRPSLYVDGDESFTTNGIEYVIGHEVSMKRNVNWGFYEKFNAINYFAQHSNIIVFGKAKLLIQKENGLCAWEINSVYGSLLVIANCKNPTEKYSFTNDDGTNYTEIVRGETIYNNTIDFPNRKLTSYYEFGYDELQKCVFAPKPLEESIENSINMEILRPAEFKVYGIE